MEGFFLHLQHWKANCISFKFAYVSLPSPRGCLVRAGLVLTGSWWGVRRDASSHNLSLGADRLVARKFIQRVLSLHLPYFEVALSTLACRTWLCVHFFSLTEERVKAQRWSARMRWSPYICFPTSRVFLSECTSACVCVGVWRWEREGRKRWRGAVCQSILALENSRSSFHVLPTISQSLSNQSVAQFSSNSHLLITFSPHSFRGIKAFFSCILCCNMSYRPKLPCQALW